MPEMSLLGFASLLTEVVAGMEEADREGLDKATEIIEGESKRVLGTHDYGWPPLKPETIARKVNGDTPLLETGQMRDSIGRSFDSREGTVGSNDDRAVWHELGTSKIPARSFLSGAAQHKEHDVVEAIGRSMVSRLMIAP